MIHSVGPLRYYYYAGISDSKGAEMFLVAPEDVGGGKTGIGKKRKEKKKKDVLLVQSQKESFGTAKRKGGSGRQPVPGWSLRLPTGCCS